MTEECTKNNNKTKIFNITVKNKNSSCKVCIILMTVVFTIFTGITIYFGLWLKIKSLALNLILIKKQSFNKIQL